MNEEKLIKGLTKLRSSLAVAGIGWAAIELVFIFGSPIHKGPGICFYLATGAYFFWYVLRSFLDGYNGK